MKPEKKNKTHYMENDKETTEPVLIHAAEMAFGASADESESDSPNKAPRQVGVSEAELAEKRVPVSELWGKWPGDETIEELLEMLKG